MNWVAPPGESLVSFPITSKLPPHSFFYPPKLDLRPRSNLGCAPAKS